MWSSSQVLRALVGRRAPRLRPEVKGCNVKGCRAKGRGHVKARWVPVTVPFRWKKNGANLGWTNGWIQKMRHWYMFNTWINQNVYSFELPKMVTQWFFVMSWFWLKKLCNLWALAGLLIVSQCATGNWWVILFCNLECQKWKGWYASNSVYPFSSGSLGRAELAKVPRLKLDGSCFLGK